MTATNAVSLAGIVGVFIGLVGIQLVLSNRSSATVLTGPTGNAYEYVSASNIRWSDALSSAQSRAYTNIAGSLASISDQAENDFVLSLLGGVSGSVWIGGRDEQDEGVWRWINGERFWVGGANGSAGPDVSYANWDFPHEPNDAGTGEDYLSMFGLNADFSLAGLWNDLAAVNGGSGIYRIQGFVIEYELPRRVGEPATLALLGLGLAGIGLARFMGSTGHRRRPQVRPFR